MTKRIFFWLWALVILAVSPALGQSRFILELSPLTPVAEVASRHGLGVVAPVDDQNRGIFLVTTPPNVPLSTVLKDVGADPAVVNFEPDLQVSLPERPALLNQSTAGILDALPAPTATSYFGTPVLGRYLDQPATSLIRLWDMQSTFHITGAGVVAVIDTGVDPNHTVLKNALVPGYDFVHEVAGTASEMADLTQSTAGILDQSTAGILDKNTVAYLNQSTAGILDQSTAGILDKTQLPAAFGHGTMVAGIIHLTAPTAQIMPLKAFRGDGTAQLFDILRAVYYARNHGAKVISMSFSLLLPSKELRNAVNSAMSNGVICVASAGNTGLPFIAYPAAIAKVIAVASTSNLDVRSRFSSYGPPVLLAAPGEAVITTYPGQNYAAVWGTSFSSPFVAGAAALFVQVKAETEQSAAIKAASQAKPLTPELGSGRLDLYRAVQFRITGK